MRFATRASRCLWSRSTHIDEVKRGFEQQAKLRYIGKELRERGADRLYVMLADADDLIHRDVVAHVRTTHNRRGYLFKDGYRFDAANGELGPPAGRLRQVLWHLFCWIFPKRGVPPLT